MDLGYIESKTFEEIEVGDTAGTDHVLTAEDAMAFASISGFTAVLKPEEIIERAGRHTSDGSEHVVRLAGLRAFQHEHPGPGMTLTEISLSFHNRIHVGIDPG